MKLRTNYQCTYLTFASVSQAELAQRTGSSNSDGSGLAWDEIPVVPGKVTYSVRITALDVYTQGNNGFNEIEIWAHDRMYSKPTFMFTE